MDAGMLQHVCSTLLMYRLLALEYSFTVSECDFSSCSPCLCLYRVTMTRWSQLTSMCHTRVTTLCWLGKRIASVSGSADGHVNCIVCQLMWSCDLRCVSADGHVTLPSAVGTDVMDIVKPSKYC